MNEHTHSSCINILLNNYVMCIPICMYIICALQWSLNAPYRIADEMSRGDITSQIRRITLEQRLIGVYIMQNIFQLKRSTPLSFFIRYLFNKYTWETVGGLQLIGVFDRIHLSVRTLYIVIICKSTSKKDIVKPLTSAYYQLYH